MSSPKRKKPQRANAETSSTNPSQELDGSKRNAFFKRALVAFILGGSKPMQVAIDKLAQLSDLDTDSRLVDAADKLTEALSLLEQVLLDGVKHGR